MRRLEAIADAVAMLNNYHDPESEAYQFRNPGMLTCELHEKKTIDRGRQIYSCFTSGAGNVYNPQHSHTEDGNRIYSCHKGGYNALWLVIQGHCLNSPHKRLVDLLPLLSVPPMQKDRIVDFIERSLNCTLNAETPLQWFIEDKNGHAVSRNTANSSR